MIWLFLLVVAVLLGVAIAAGWLAPTRGFGTRIAGVLLALALLIILTSVLWKHAVLALAIAAVVALAVGVMFQKVTPGKAIGAAIGAFILLFAFVWLALQLADPFLFDKESDLSCWIRGLFKEHGLLDGRIHRPGVFIALGAAALLASRFLHGWTRALAVFLGATLMLAFLPMALERCGLNWENLFHSHDPVLQLAIICAVLIALLGVVRMIINNRKP